MAISVATRRITVASGGRLQVDVATDSAVAEMVVVRVVVRVVAETKQAVAIVLGPNILDLAGIAVANISTTTALRR